MLRYTLLALLCCVVSAQTVSSPAGKWISNLKYFENDNYDRLQFELNDTKLTGKLGDDNFEGTFQNGRIEGTMKWGPRETLKLVGTLKGGRIEGTATIIEEKLDLKWEAYREPEKSASAPKTYTFETYPV
jgi:hypothetical protein